MKTYLTTFALIVGSVLLAPHNVAADAYKWVDENGVIHYTAQPPGDRNAEAVSTPTEPRKSETSKPVQENAGRKATALEIDEIKAAERPVPPSVAVRTGKPELTQEEQAEECQRNRQIIAQVEPRTRVMLTDADGNKRRLSDQERLSLLDEKRDYIAENC